MGRKINVQPGLRRHDVDMLARGATLGYRVQEPDWAECYFCDEQGVKDSKEHILPRWMVSELGMKAQEFAPEYHSGTRVGERSPTHARGAIPAHSLVAQNICQTCNNGWMGSLEGTFKPFLADPALVDLGLVARWFTKTAFVLNVTQNTRLQVPRADRLRLARNVLPGSVSIYVHRTDIPPASDVEFNWIQGAQAAPVTVPNEYIPSVVASSRELWACSIRIRDVVTTVIVNPPNESWASSWEVVGAPLARSGRISERLDWENLPRLTDPQHGVLLVPRSTAWRNAFFSVGTLAPFPTGVRGIFEVRDVIRVTADAHKYVVPPGADTPFN